MQQELQTFKEATLDPQPLDYPTWVGNFNWKLNKNIHQLLASLTAKYSI